MIRRDFLRRLAVSAAGLLVTDDVLDLLVEPRRKLWPGADLEPSWRHISDYDGKEAYVREYFSFVWDSPPKGFARTVGITEDSITTDVGYDGDPWTV